MITLDRLQKALGGDVAGAQLLAPGPGHSAQDRSLAIRPAGDNVDGFVVHSHAGDDWRMCRDYVAERLGTGSRRAADRPPARVSAKPAPAVVDKRQSALAIWNEAVDPRGTVVETYLSSRGLVLDDVIAGAVIRYHSSCPFRPGERMPCMVAAYRSIATGEIQAIHRTALTPDGVKVDRLALGPKSGTAIMFDALDAERGSLGIGEGIETTLSGRQMGYAPAWSLGDANGIAKLPLIDGIESLSIFAEHDESGTNQRASQECGGRYREAGREVFLIHPKEGKDLNDAWQVRDQIAGEPITVQTFGEDGTGILKTEETLIADDEIQLAPLDFITATELLAQPLEPRPWHVPEMVPGGTVTMLSGDGATGKSLVALQLAVATVAGIRWLGNEVDRGGALFITAEDELRDARLRLNDICSADGIAPADLNELRIKSLAGCDALLAVPDTKRGGVLQATELFARVKLLVKSCRPKLTVLDTLADLFGGNEIDRAQARQFISMLRGLAIECDTTVILLGHPSLTGMASGTGSSGSTAWNNSVRSRLYLKRIVQKDGNSTIEPDADLRSLSTVKANYGKSGGEIVIRWRDGRFVPEHPGTGLSSLEAGAARNRADRVFLALLATYSTDGRKVSSKPGPTYAPRVFANDGRSEGITAKGFLDAMNRLFEQGAIRNIETGPPSTRRSHIEATRRPFSLQDDDEESL